MYIKEIYFKELASPTGGGAGRSDIWMAGCQEGEAGNTCAGAEATAPRQNFFLPRESSALLLWPFNNYLLLYRNLI